jgi:hypothetical protein
MRSAIQGQNTQKGNPTKSRTVLANSRPKTTTDIKKSRERSPMIAEFLLRKRRNAIRFKFRSEFYVYVHFQATVSQYFN